MVNKVILVGRVGREPEIKYTKSGTAVASFSVATTEKWKDKQSGEMKEQTEWSNITAWGRLAEIIGEYVNKGDLIYIEGKLQTDKWEKDGQTHYTTKIVAREMKMLGGKSESQQPSRHGDGPPLPEDDDGDIPF